MQSNISSIISALKIIYKENPESDSIALLEDALKETMKLYLLDMASIGTVIDMEELEDEFKNIMRLVEIAKPK